MKSSVANVKTLKMHQFMTETNRSLPIHSLFARPVRQLAGGFCFAVALAAAIPFTSASPANNLKAGDIVIADSNAGVLKLDCVSAQTSVLSAGYPLVQPYGVAIDAKGALFVTDTGIRAVVRIDPASGQKQIVAPNVPGLPFGIAVDAQGDLLVANTTDILRIKPNSGAVSVVPTARSLTNFLRVPLGVAVAADGGILVADGSGCVVRVDPASGAQSLVSSGQYLAQPVGIALDAHGNILIADSVARRVVEVDPVTGVQTVLSEAASLATPVSVAIDKTGAILVSDPDAFNLDGGIMRLNPPDPTPNPVMTGSGDYVNPRGIAVVRSPSNRHN